MLHGGVPTGRRPALLDHFREQGDVRVLLSTEAGGLGLNLQVASYVVHLDLPWNPARLDQRTSRAHRMGQTRGVTVTCLCAEEGIERGIEGILATKRAVRGAALDAGSTTDTMETPSFNVMLQQVREILEGLEEPGGAAEVEIVPAATPRVAPTHVLPSPAGREARGNAATSGRGASQAQARSMLREWRSTAISLPRR
jgi:superfamily II DNA/RNA helicase